MVALSSTAPAQPVFIWRYDPNTKTVVPDAKPSA
jgi:hypothetical protein